MKKVFGITVVGIVFLAAVSLYSTGLADKGEPKVYPIYDYTQYCLLGGWSENGWMIYDSTAPHIKGGEKYEYYSMFKSYGFSKGTQPRNSDMGACPEIFNIDFADSVSSDDHIVAFSGDWNALPRVPKSIKPDSRTKKIVSEFLKKSGINKTNINIKKVFIIDIEGRGLYDTVITAAHYKGEFYDPPKKGYYSIVLLQRYIDGASVTIPIVTDIHAGKEDEGSLMYMNTVLGFFDFNNDGRLEILLDESYYEGSYSVLMDIQKNEPVPILDCGCGL